MTHVSLTVNGRAVSAEVEPRTHLADFLRENLLLTGTHIGCEQGVCGACTILLNGEPARSCITFASLCEGVEIRTIEGLADDPVAAALRHAFAAEHGLQCGYCTPGMMVTARDIVLRVPDADEDRIRLELAGNLCRCTGYNGIVRAIRRVLDEGIAEAEVSAVPSAAVVAPPPVIAALSNADHDQTRTGADKETTAPGSTASGPTAPGSREASLRPALRIAQPPGIVWAAIQDPAFVASCVPGAAVLGGNGNQIEGEMQASLGPIRARFAGRAMVTFDEATRTGRLAGEGRDKTSGTRLSGEARFAVEADGSAATILRLDITYSMRGPLSQFGRGPVIEAFASEIADQVGRNVEAHLQGRAPPPSPGTIALLWRTLRRWLRGTHG